MIDILQFKRNMPDTAVKSTEKMENEEMEQCTLCDKVSSSFFIIHFPDIYTEFTHISRPIEL